MAMCRHALINVSIFLSLLVINTGTALAENTLQDFPLPPNSIDGAKTYIYKTENNFDLPIYLFIPTNHSNSDEKRTAVVFFHGSGWKSGSVLQFADYARLLSIHGMVTALAEYRVKDRYDATPFDGLEDVKSAIRWLRHNTDNFKIDKNKIVAAGASAGGHLALSAAVFNNNLNNNQDTLKTTSAPDALVLFSTVVDTSSAGYKDSEGLKLFNGNNLKLSPIIHLKQGLPPTLILHGTNDKWIPFSSISRFVSLMQDVGNNIQLVPFSGRGHHFYGHPNYLESRPRLASLSAKSDFAMTLYLMEKFLYELNMMKELPVVVQLKLPMTD